MATQVHPVRNAARGVTFVGYLLRPRSRADDLYPFDSPDGSIPGTDADRVLVIGEATAMGYGVLTHELGLAGQFARKLARRTKRGVEWSAVPLPGSRLRSAPELIATMGPALSRTDYVVLVAGIVDTLSLTTRAAWRRQLSDTLEALIQRLPMDGQVLIAEIPPLGKAAVVSPLSRLASAHQSRALNRASQLVAAAYPRCETVPFPVDLHQAMWSTHTLPASYAAMYGSWATVIATAADADSRSASSRP